MNAPTLRGLIRRTELLQRDVADALRVDPSYVTDWIYGRRLKALKRHAAALGEVLGVSENDVLRAAGLDEQPEEQH